MSKDNKHQIQQIPNNKHDNLHIAKLQQYLGLCHDVLQIGSQIAAYLPHVQQPSVEAFQRLYEMEVTNRQSREVKAMHLASAYFSTQSNERQYELREKFISFLNKLRIVPAKIRVLLELQQLTQELRMGCEVIASRVKLAGECYSSQMRLDGVITPNQMIEKCRCLRDALRGYVQQNEGHRSQVNRHSSPVANKHQLQQYYYAKHQLSLQHDFISILQWRYSACIIASLTLLQKQSKPLLLKFIKQTKKLTKSSIINISHVARIYAFCLVNICEHSPSLETVQRVVYFQLELKRILVQRRNLLDAIVVEEVQSVMKMAREVTEKNVIKKYASNIDHSGGIDILFKQTHNLIQKQTISDGKYPSTRNNSNLATHNKYKLNIGSTKPSLSQFTTTNRHFLTTNRFSLKSMSKNFGLSDNKESQSLNKIKEYQLSLRKSRENDSASGVKRRRTKEQTVRSMYEEAGFHLSHRKGILTNKNVSSASSRPLTRQLSKGKSIFSSHPPTSTSRPASFTKHLYQSLQQTNHRHQQITPTSLQHQMFIIPEIIYQKPCITFTQIILLNRRLTQQMQNQSQTIGLGFVASQMITCKIQVRGSCVMMINGGGIVMIEICKPVDQVENFVCVLREQRQFGSRVNLEQMATLKSVKSTIQSTDLFFQLIQEDIKQRLTQATTKAIIQANSLQRLQKTDHQTYVAYFNIYNAMAVIGNYVKPYVYWYWTKRAKINGVVVAKREKMEMSDPLKFSISLESFKKNDVQGCVNIFKTVRSRKGLKQCISYLSQGRQIICRHLKKAPNGKWFIELVELQHKYMRNFEISQQNELVFPILKLSIKRLKVTEAYKTKQSSLIENAFKKLFCRDSVKKKSLKKKNKTIAMMVEQQQQVNPAQREQHINMHSIFSNNQCNELLINNITRNFISPRFINKIIAYISCQLNRQQQEWRVIQSELVRLNNSDGQEKGKEMRINYHEAEENIFDVLVGEEKHCSMNKKEEVNASLSDALKRYVIGVIGVVNEQEEQVEGMDWSLRRRQRRTLRRRVQMQSFGNHQFTQHQFNNPYAKQKSNLRFILNSKLIAFSSLLISMSQTYQQPMMFTILGTLVRKVKIGRVFYTLQVYRFSNLRYFIVLRDNNCQKQWVMYVSQKIIRLMDLLMGGDQAMNISQFKNVHVNSAVDECFQKKIVLNYHSHSQVFTSQHHQQNHSSSQLNDNSLPHKTQSYLFKKQISSSQLQQSSNKQSHHATCYSQFIPSIINNQSGKFHLQLLKTPYMDKLAIQKKETGTYFVSRVNSKNNKFSILINWLIVIERKIVRLKDLSSLQGNIINGKYVYLACSYDMKFEHYRFDIYLHGTQQKFVAFVDNEQLPLDFNADYINKCNNNSISILLAESTKVITDLLDWKMIKINFQSQILVIKQTQFKMFQTFDQLTLPHKDITLQHNQVTPTVEQKAPPNQTILVNQSHPHPLTTSISKQNTTKNSGFIELLKHNSSIQLLVLDYNREQILMSEVEEDPEHLFNNIYAECLYKQTPNVIYQNLLRRTYQKVRNGTLQLTLTSVRQFGKVVHSLI